MDVRDAEERDLPALLAIYNHYVEHHHATFDVEPRSIEAQHAWFAGFSVRGPYRLLVALEADRVLGFASSAPFKARPAYAVSVETSVYLRPEAIGRGVARALYERLFDALADEDLHGAFAGIAQPNDASVRLHERFGFRHVGTFPEVGRKFGRYWDVAWYRRPLD